MSTKQQAKGRGLERQVHRSAEYALKHGLELDDRVKFHDIGVSAFKGKNLTHGMLGEFLKLVQSGEIRQGSYLLVDSLDRLSRNDCPQALHLLLSIIHSGITLVTLSEEEAAVYKEGEVEELQLFSSIVTMARANNESRRKSEINKSNWAAKRSRAATAKLTKWCPAWLKLTSDRSKFEPIPDRVRVVQRIFTECAEGIGIYTITRRLNETSVPPFDGARSSNGWHASYVAKILNNRAVLGEFQAHKRDSSGKRVPDGPVVADYFPAVVDRELFFRAMSARQSRNPKHDGRPSAGRKGVFYSNVFSGLLDCPYCYSKVSMASKGSGPKGGAYLICDSVRRGLGCVASSWRYEKFETSALTFVDKFDWSALFSDSESSEELVRLKAKIEAKKGELGELRLARDNAFWSAISSVAAKEYLSQQLDKLSDRIASLEADLIEARSEYDDFKSNYERTRAGGQEILTLLQRLRRGRYKAQQRYQIRAQIAQAIRATVKHIDVYGSGGDPKLFKFQKFDRPLSERQRKDIDVIRDKLRADTPSRFFVVTFNDDSVLKVRPDPDQPQALASLAYGKIGSDSVTVHETGRAPTKAPIMKGDPSRPKLKIQS
ncbi:MAG: recombinase family protein [Pseudolabrys sp.]|nr:recombinase family protein [Pseudolabrys sp.]